jgi:hypothetical protein
MIAEETFMTVHGIPTPPAIPIIPIILAGGGVLAAGWLLGQTKETIKEGVELGKVMTTMLLPMIPVGIGLALMFLGKTETERKIGLIAMVGGGALAMFTGLASMKK